MGVSLKPLLSLRIARFFPLSLPPLREPIAADTLRIEGSENKRPRFEAVKAKDERRGKEGEGSSSGRKAGAK
jgi:hypothetical protein